MSNDHFGGILILIFGILIGGMATLIAVLTAKKMGVVVWKWPVSLGVFIGGWALGLGMTIAGIVLLAR